MSEPAALDSKQFNGRQGMSPRALVSSPTWLVGLGWLTAAAVLVGLVVALGRAPQVVGLGQSAPILYVHVGAAWVAYLSYGMTALGAVLFLWRREPKWDRLALASAEWGVILTTVTLLSGMLWGKAAQGWWWRWDDPRLTLTLLMWFVYAGYLILRQYTEGERRAAVSAVMALVGIPAMVLNHFATVLYRTFHPTPIFIRPAGPAADPPIVSAVVLSVAAYTLLYACLLAHRIRLEALRDAVAVLDAQRDGQIDGR